MPCLSQVIDVVNTLFKISQKYKKHYCYPSQATLLKKLEEFYGISRSFSTLNRWLSQLEAANFIKRVRRLQRMPNGQIQFRSTMYFVTKAGVLALHRYGRDVWDVLSKWWLDSKRLREQAALARKKTQEKLISWADFKKDRAAELAARAPT